MYNLIIKIRNWKIRQLYKFILKPILFKFDPEFVHDRFSAAGVLIGGNIVTRFASSLMFGYEHKMLAQEIYGINFKNPIGLSAGFDKNAILTKVIPTVGFGFEEIGSVTGLQCAGNPKPRLWRHTDQQSLRVYYGLKNNGAAEIAGRLRGQKFRIPIGISIAKTNCLATVDTALAIADYKKAMLAFDDIGDYLTINISCPNTFGGQPFTDPIRFEALLKGLLTSIDHKPVFIKLSPDLSKSELLELLEVASRYRVDGVICSNLTKIHNEGSGGLSGKVVTEKSLKAIKIIRKYYQNRFTIIAVGGIFNADDAYSAIKAGASLIQLITGMIYGGPQTISEINLGLVERLKKDGFKNIKEAIGTNARR